MEGAMHIAIIGMGNVARRSADGGESAGIRSHLAFVIQ